MRYSQVSADVGKYNVCGNALVVADCAEDDDSGFLSLKVINCRDADRLGNLLLNAWDRATLVQCSCSQAATQSRSDHMQCSVMSNRKSSESQKITLALSCQVTIFNLHNEPVPANGLFCSDKSASLT
jgi:hypothetical protein